MSRHLCNPGDSARRHPAPPSEPAPPGRRRVQGPVDELEEPGQADQGAQGGEPAVDGGRGQALLAELDQVVVDQLVGQAGAAGQQLAGRRLAGLGAQEACEVLGVLSLMPPRAGPWKRSIGQWVRRRSSRSTGANTRQPT
jgi:hypothetical protein